MRPNRMCKTRLAAARHEAAHAVIATRFGARVRRVELFPAVRGYSRGETYMTGLRKLGLVQAACVMMAGSVAEHLWHGTPKGLVSLYDYRDLRAVGLKGEDMRIVWQETSRLLRQSKREVWKLSDRLMRKGVVRG